MTPHDAEWHRARFAEFALYELACGGPDPHMRYVDWMSRDVGWYEKAWRIGCYVGVYNVASAEAIWREWPWERYVDEGFAQMEGWLIRHWAGLQIRRERRTVKSPAKLATYFVGFARWLRDRAADDLDQDYEHAQHVTLGLPHVGRYAATKLLEAFRRTLKAPYDFPDIWPDGGWSPRITLNIMFPHLERDPYDNTPQALGVVDLQTGLSVTDVQQRTGLDLDFFTLEVLLCEYHESYHGRRQYPGRSHDSELKYGRKVEPYWKQNADGFNGLRMWQARRALAPASSLGEDRGWYEPRKELGLMLSQKGIVWSDLLWDYKPEAEDYESYKITRDEIVQMARNTLEAVR